MTSSKVMLSIHSLDRTAHSSVSKLIAHGYKTVSQKLLNHEGKLRYALCRRSGIPRLVELSLQGTYEPVPNHLTKLTNGIFSVTASPYSK